MSLDYVPILSLWVPPTSPVIPHYTVKAMNCQIVEWGSRSGGYGIQRRVLRFGGTRRLYLHGPRMRAQMRKREAVDKRSWASFLNPEDGSDMFLQQVGSLPTDCTALYLKDGDTFQNGISAVRFTLLQARGPDSAFFGTAQMATAHMKNCSSQTRQADFIKGNTARNSCSHKSAHRPWSWLHGLLAEPSPGSHVRSATWYVQPSATQRGWILCEFETVKVKLYL
jgi:hypothetical protein